MKMLWLCVFLFAIALVAPVNAVTTCPVMNEQKNSTLYLYFPLVSDATFPAYGGYATSPANPFNVSDLDPSIGTTAQLRQKIFDVVAYDYCEFSVKIKMNTSAPATSEPRWQIVAVGSDSNPALFGLAQNVDVGDADSQDYARVWSKSFLDSYGGAGGALNGNKSNLERWANAIGATAAHEAGHNYGLYHENATPVPGSAEDNITNHVMATNNLGLTGELRAGLRRHFSDTSYEILAHNVGLTVSTIHNWDFVNPNNIDAHALRLKLLSNASNLTVNWFYNGGSSPWTNPVVTKTGGTENFQGANLNVYYIDFNASKAWTGGAAGVAPPAVRFHIGATFSEPKAVIVTETNLFNISGAELPLRPRMIGYDKGNLSNPHGDYLLNFFNPTPADGPLILKDLRVIRTPRMIDIDMMVADSRLLDIGGVPVKDEGILIAGKGLEIKDRLSLKIAQLTDKRTVDITYNNTGCVKGISKSQNLLMISRGIGDPIVGEIEYCPKGTALSLFPSTYVYVTATIVDPNAKHWNPITGSFEVGAVESKLFYQFAGIVPDLNKNGVDDLLDIRTGTSIDENNNGVPDEVEKKPSEAVKCCSQENIYNLLTIIIVMNILILILVMYIILVKCNSTAGKRK